MPVSRHLQQVTEAAKETGFADYFLGDLLRVRNEVGQDFKDEVARFDVCSAVLHLLEKQTVKGLE